MASPHEQQLRAALLDLALAGLGDDQLQQVEDTLRRHLRGDVAHPDRYEARHELGRGGMGRVVLVEDLWLGRPVARKEVLGGHDPGASDRLMEEARTLARLRHPNILPLLDLHSDEDGVSYTMPVLPHGTLRDLIGVAACDPRLWPPRRLIDAVRQVAAAVAHAHDQGVLHRDIKPDNVMVGDHGEVYLTDWGLSKTLLPGAIAGANTTPAGTPGYMAPEQGCGEPTGPFTDVYQLGALLHEVLCAGPSEQAAAEDDELLALCQRARTPQPGDRPTAVQFVRAIDAWLDQERRLQQANALLQEVDRRRPEAEITRQRAEQATREAQELDLHLPPWAPIVDRQRLWEAEAAATRLRDEAAAEEQWRLKTLQDVVELAPQITPAREELADAWKQQAQEAAHRGDRRSAQAATDAVRRFGTDRHRRWLTGEGSLTLYTTPPGAEVMAERQEVRGRRLVTVERRSLGTTPLIDRSLPEGSWVLHLQAPDHTPVRYPVLLSRDEPWSGVPPEGGPPLPISLPRLGEIGPDEAYVPAGWMSGGSWLDDLAPPPRPVWVDSFIIRRHPVTNAEYIQWLNQLWQHGERELALRLAPRPTGEGEPSPSHIVYALHDQTGFSLRPSTRIGQDWLPGFPVVYIDWHAATACARWFARQQGLDWRLPTEWEWEKAARGVDRRRFPWGDTFEPGFACVGGSRPPGQDATPLEVHDPRFGDDTSPYGVRSMAGNSADWCLDPWRHRGPQLDPNGRAPAPEQILPGPTDERALRGGHWYSAPHGLARRTGVYTSDRKSTLGLRLVRSWGRA